MSVASDRLGTCEFIADHALELAKLAETAGFPIIRYIADMLYEEATNQCKAGLPEDEGKSDLAGNGDQPAGNPVAFAP